MGDAPLARRRRLVSKLYRGTHWGVAACRPFSRIPHDRARHAGLHFSQFTWGAQATAKKMNQNSDTEADNGSASTPRARPQLFGAPRAAQPLNDFGPSILATIDGGQPRFSNRRRRQSKLWWLVLGVPVAAAALYGAVRINTAQPSMAAQASAVNAAPKAVPVVQAASAVARVAAAPASSVVPQGAATIETVAQAASAPTTGVRVPIAAAAASGAALPVLVAAVAAPPPTVAQPVPPLMAPVESKPSTASIEKPPAVSRPEVVAAKPPRTERSKDSGKDSSKAVKPSAESRSKEKQPAQAEAASPAKTRLADASGTGKAPYVEPARGTPDSDAELLAAMLPHLQRLSAAPAPPTSPAYNKRCGTQKGKAADACRVKFCNGRQGSDAACPVKPAAKAP